MKDVMTLICTFCLPQIDFYKKSKNTYYYTKSGYKSRYIKLKAYLKVFARNTAKNVFRIVCIIYL